MTDYPPSWTCEIVLRRLDRYVLAQLPRGELIAMAEHVEACVLCMQQLMLLWSKSERRDWR